MNPNYDDDDGFMGGGGSPSFKFDQVGHTITGLVLGPPVKRVQTDMKTREVKTYRTDRLAICMWLSCKPNCGIATTPRTTGYAAYS